MSARTADLSRRHKVETSPEGVVLVTGGKWTTYRQMAEDALDEVAQQLPGVTKCVTRSLPLHGSPGKRTVEVPGVSDDVAAHLVGRFGTDAPSVAALITADHHLGDRIAVGLPFLGAEVVYAVRSEMAITLEDVLARRTRAHLQDARAAAGAAREVAAIMAAELGWSAERTEDEVASYLRSVDDEFIAAGLTSLTKEP